MSSFRLIVVEQKEGEGDWSSLPADERIVHVRAQSAGKSIALNHGLQFADEELVFFTDDDCTVPTDWLEKGVLLFSKYPNVGAIFSPLRAAPFNPTIEWVPTFEPSHDRVMRGSLAFLQHLGAGANLAVRLSVLNTVGPFDEELGPGAKYKGLEEFDYFYRMLRCGTEVLYETTNPVVHWGVRSHTNGASSALLQGYRRGEGAVIAKHLKCGDFRTLLLLGRETLASMRFAARTLVTTGRPRGLLPWSALLRGFAAGLVHPVDHNQRLFRRSGVDLSSITS